MGKLKINFILLIILSFLISCSPNWEYFKVNSGEIYSINSLDRHMSISSPNGVWTEFRPKDRESSVISNRSWRLSAKSKYKAVGYSSRIGLEFSERFPDYKKRYTELLSHGNFERSIDEYIENFYTEKLRDEVKISNVNGSVTSIGGYKCMQFDESQSYGPPPESVEWGHTHQSRHMTTIFCPMVIGNEIWQIYASYTISVGSKEFDDAYGVNAPTVEDLRKDIRARLQPMYDSVVVSGNPTQTLPEGYR